MTESAASQRVVIIGGGFAGLAAATRLAKSGAQITIVDRSNAHVFQPLLYQVATGALSPANISAPIRAVLAKHRNVRCLHGEVTRIDPTRRSVETTAARLEYDQLIVAAGAEESYFGNDEWREHTIGLKSIAQALHMRSWILSRFEEAEWCDDEQRRRSLMTFVVVGGGPTGVELAGAIAELAHNTLRRDFRNIDPRRTRVVLAEMIPKLLPPFADELSHRAARDLEELGVEVRTGCKVLDIDEGGIELGCKTGDDDEDVREERIAADSVLWAAGVKANGLGAQLCTALGIEPAKGGAVPVASDCTLAGHPEIFVVGDLAKLVDSKEREVPNLAPAALQQGVYVAKLLRRRWKGKDTKPFTYFDKGMMATIGRNKAVVETKGLRFGGRLAWYAWLLVHLTYLIGFDNRFLVLLQWFWNYLNRGRNARLIVGRSQQRILAEGRTPEHERTVAPGSEPSPDSGEPAKPDTGTAPTEQREQTEQPEYSGESASTPDRGR